MMEHYVTLFDRTFLPQGLALYKSLEDHAGEFTLWVVCMDSETGTVLETLALPHLRWIPLEEIETADLRKVKSGRTRAEYCWTVTPFCPEMVFKIDPTVKRVTYVDADVQLLRSPAPVFRAFECSGKQVLITRHAYAAEYDQSSTSGIFCVQFMIFNRAADEVYRWWQDRCIEWCFSRYEDGKFGDQKYLDDWPDRFASVVHVLENLEWTLAPWNATRFPFSEAIMYHFHGLRIISGKRVYIGEYPLPPVLVRNVYLPYLASLRQSIGLLSKVGCDMTPQHRQLSVFNRLAKNLEMLYAERWRLNRGRTECF